MPRPLPRRQSSSLPPPPKLGYTPYNEDVEADYYFQPRGRRSSTPGHIHSDTHRRRPESVTGHNRDPRRRPSSRDSYDRPSNRPYNPRDEEPRGRHPHRPSRSTESHHRRFHHRSSSPSSLSSSPSTSRSSSTSSSLSSHYYNNPSSRHHHLRNKTKNYYPPSSSRKQTHHQPSHPPKRTPFHRLRSLSLPTPHNLNKNPLKNPASIPPPKRTPSEIFLRAAQCAAEAGAVAALKLRDDPSPWIGAKGSKIAAAALSAAAVDTFMEQKHPNRKGGIRHTVMRQITQMAIGNLVKVGGGDGGKGGGGGKGGRVGGGGGGGRRR